MTVAPNKASSESNSNNLKKDDFPKTAPAAYPVFFRSYSRKTSYGKRENWSEVGERNLSGLKEFRKAFKDAADQGAYMDRKYLDQLHEFLDEALSNAQAEAELQIEDFEALEDAKFYQQEIKDATRANDVEGILRLQKLTN